MKVLLALVVVIVLAVGAFLKLGQGTTGKTKPPSSPPQAQIQQQESSQSSDQTSEQVKTIRAQDIAGVAAAFIFSAEIPSNWQVEAIAATEAINFYDSGAAGTTNLEKSQIFIRSFKANSFLTLGTVTIHAREDTTLNGRPAVRYDIEKKPAVAQFSGQPSWRSERHIVTDVRVSDANPSVFYVIGKRPDLDETVYRSFLQSFNVRSSQAGLTKPIDELTSRITKKPFGIFITRENSPVQPERFSGYHTGIDVEYEDKPNVPIPVHAIAPGRVVHSGRAAGYGGVLVISHQIGSENKLALYGHLDPSSLLKIGSEVSAGQRIGILGEGGTSETDGERRHLHFAVIKGETVNLKGYVKNQQDLAGWEDPLKIFE